MGGGLLMLPEEETEVVERLRRGEAHGGCASTQRGEDLSVSGGDAALQAEGHTASVGGSAV